MANPFKMKYTDGKKASPAKMFGSMRNPLQGIKGFMGKEAFNQAKASFKGGSMNEMIGHMRDKFRGSGAADNESVKDKVKRKTEEKTEQVAEAKVAKAAAELDNQQGR